MTVGEFNEALVDLVNNKVVGILLLYLWGFLSGYIAGRKS